MKAEHLKHLIDKFSTPKEKGTVHGTLVLKLIKEYCILIKELESRRVLINSLNFKQAMKWIFIHEQRRHEDDVRGIQKDLLALQDVELPPEVEELAGQIHFEVR